MSEQKIQSKILKWLHANGYYAIKTITCNRAGVPDILACSPAGLFVAIEVKQPGGRVSELQKAHIEQITAVNGKAFVAYSLDDVKKELGQ